jgi:hypothetical protein
MLLWVMVLCSVAGAATGVAQDLDGFEGVDAFNLMPDPGCVLSQAWAGQGNPRTDIAGIRNHALPDWNATYWGTVVNAFPGTVVTIRGRFPKARYFSFQVYNSLTLVLSTLVDQNIDPDAGQNNPFRGGNAQGTYTLRLVFGSAPSNPAPNTLYTAGSVSVLVVYRVYYPDNPNDLTGATFNPVLPTVDVPGKGTLATCAPRPILSPEEATINGRVNDSDFVGTKPHFFNLATNPPIWLFQTTFPFIPFIANRDNSYMYTAISRTYLRPPYTNNMVVIHMRTPTFPDTQAGAPPYAPANVRYWSICQNETLSYSVIRCVPDHSAINTNGMTTIVISDPSFRPSDAVLTKWGARWIPWGALLPDDFILDRSLNPVTNADGAFYYGIVMYRQTLAHPSFTQSIDNVANLPFWERRGAMGDYLPDIGYCSAANFQALGGNCIK